MSRQIFKENLAEDEKLMHWIIKNDLHDKEFIAQRCEGFEALAAEIEKYPLKVYGKEEKAALTNLEDFSKRS